LSDLFFVLLKIPVLYCKGSHNKNSLNPKTYPMKKLSFLASLNVIAFFLPAIFFLSSCDGEDPVIKVPVIISIDPSSGKFSTTVTIIGTDFDPTLEGNAVNFNGKQAQVTAATATTLKVIVPKGAGTGKISVESLGQVVEGPTFTYVYTATVSTFAGTGASGFLDANGTSAKFNFPAGLAFDSQDNLFVCDRTNSKIRKITPTGEVTTFAGSTGGSADGTGTAAQIGLPTGITIDATGDFYIAESGSGKIRKITPAGVVTTIAGTGTSGYAEGPALSSQFEFPTGVVKDSQGNLLIADFTNARVRKITPNGIVSTLAGDGSAALKPWGIITDSQDNVYMTDFANFRIRKITPAGVVSIFTGTGSSGFLDGPIGSAQFGNLYGIIRDKNGDLIVSDSENNRIRRISNGVVSTIAGEGSAGLVDGEGSVAKFYSPYSLAINSKGEIFVGERNNYTIRKIVLE
jgi:sugar lactone lactonase YvrE